MLKEKHEHIDKLPGVKLPDSITFTTDIAVSYTHLFTRGDDEKKVLENYKRVAEAIGADVYKRQTR